jgi:hypothetical protein
MPDRYPAGRIQTMKEARLEHITHGVAPVTDGWFVLNAADAQWIHHPDFGWQCPFEANGPVVRQRDDLEPVHFPQLGVNLLVFDEQQALAGQHEERPLRQWDFFHSPPGTEHVLVGTGEPCVVLRAGTRLGYPGLRYPRAEVAVKHGAAADRETTSGAKAYASRGHWQPSEKPAGIP